MRNNMWMGEAEGVACLGKNEVNNMNFQFYKPNFHYMCQITFIFPKGRAIQRSIVFEKASEYYKMILKLPLFQVFHE